MVRDKKGIMCWTQASGKKACVDKTNAQLRTRDGKRAKPTQNKYNPNPTPMKEGNMKTSEVMRRELNKLGVVDLRKLARSRGVKGAQTSLMRKGELVDMLVPQPKAKYGVSLDFFKDFMKRKDDTPPPAAPKKKAEAPKKKAPAKKRKLKIVG